MDRKLINKSDIIILCCVILATMSFLGFHRFQNNSSVAVIEKSGVEIQRIDLSSVKKPYTINVDSAYPCVILVERGKISFKEASCPDKLCKKMGKISYPAQTAICLPAGVIIKIEGENTGIDAFTG